MTSPNPTITTAQTKATRLSLTGVLAVALASSALACNREQGDASPSTPITRVAGGEYVVRDTTVQATFAASGVAAPLRHATLSTKLMGTVVEVLVTEGEMVAAGQPLVRIDARDLAAKSSQVAASMSEAEAMHRDAVTQAGRIRALYADSAATRAQLDAAETGLARAEAGVRAARGAAAELGAMREYAVIRAPFAGVVTKRFVDPGSFATPGAPLAEIQDARQLRITASATPDVARAIRAGQTLAATIEGRSVRAIVEGVVPAAAGNLYSINALVANPGWAILPGSTATLALVSGERSTLVVPAAAVTREGDLTGVTLRTARGDELRWVRLGAVAGDGIEVSAGLRPGDRIVVPAGPAKLAERS